MNFLYKKSKSIKEKKIFFFLLFVGVRGGGGAGCGEGGTRESEFFTRNPNVQKKIFFWRGLGEAGGWGLE